MAKIDKKGPAQLRPGKAGVSGAVRKGGGRVLTNAAGAEAAGKAAGVERSHVPHQDAGARKALRAIGAALKGLHGLTSDAQALVDSAHREVESL